MKVEALATAEFTCCGPTRDLSRNHGSIIWMTAENVRDIDWLDERRDCFVV